MPATKPETDPILYLTKHGAVDLRRVGDKLTIIETNKRRDLDRTMFGKCLSLVVRELKLYGPAVVVKTLWPGGYWAVIEAEELERLRIIADGVEATPDGDGPALVPVDPEVFSNLGFGA